MKDYTPDETTAQVTVEGLKDDILPYDTGIPSYNFVFTASWGAQYLIGHPKIGTRPLEDALFSGDRQQKFLSAYILSVTGWNNEAEKIAGILIPNLKDDRVIQNACFATRALYKLGKEGLPSLKRFTSSTDAQQRKMVGFIIKEIEISQGLNAQMPDRNLKQCITHAVTNPATRIQLNHFDGIRETNYSFYDDFEND